MTQSSTSKKDRLALFSILLVLVLVVILSNVKSDQTIEVVNGPTEPPNIQGPTGPPPTS
jgi:hypothetical protein